MHRLWVLLALSACTGMVDSSAGVNTPDAAAGGGGGGSNRDAGGKSALDAATPLPDGASGLLCKNQVLTGLGSGHHNAGQDCLNGCHNHGFTLAGTIYSGGAALTGATVTVKDANGTTFDVVSQLDGNFYTTQAVTFPLTVYASSCPSMQPMVATVAAGGCNKSGCHASNAQGQIHLP